MFLRTFFFPFLFKKVFERSRKYFWWMEKRLYRAYCKHFKLKYKHERTEYYTLHYTSPCKTVTQTKKHFLLNKIREYFQVTIVRSPLTIVMVQYQGNSCGTFSPVIKCQLNHEYGQSSNIKVFKMSKKFLTSEIHNSPTEQFTMKKIVDSGQNQQHTVQRFCSRHFQDRKSKA